jgi:hypothetical protein
LYAKQLRSYIKYKNTKKGGKLLFIPDTYFMGAEKNNPTILEYVNYLHDRMKTGHMTREFEFLGDVNVGCVGSINVGKMNLIGGEYIGISKRERESQFW